MDFIKKQEKKIFVLSIIFIILLIIFVTIPTLSEYKVSNPSDSVVVWDGVVATSYKDGDGSIDKPYIISNGSELAYFALQLNDTNYEGKYFVLENDIILNDGVFDYTENNEIKYIKDDEEKKIEPSLENSYINVFQHLNGFKGNFDGNNHTIYGIYIDESIDGQNALFTNLEGNVSNLYIKNSLIYGGKITGGIVSKAKNSILTNVSYDGFVISDNDFKSEVLTLELDDIVGNIVSSELVDYININDLSYIPGVITEVTLSGRLTITGDLNAILKINDEIINPGDFKLVFDDKLQSQISLYYQTDLESNFSLENLRYEVSYSYGNAAGIVSIADNTIIKNAINKADIHASVYASGIVNTVYGETSLLNVYNTGSIESDNISTGLVSSINQNTKNVSITNCYNSGKLMAINNSLIGNIENNLGNVILLNIFNTQDSFGINSIETTDVFINNSYVISNKYINSGSANGEFILVSLDDLENKSYVQENLKYLEYTGIDDDAVWVWKFDDDSLPILYIDELNKPLANIYIREYIWSDYKKNIDTLKFDDKLIFNVEQIGEFNSIKDMYYYVSNEKVVLTKKELDDLNTWETYDDIVELNNEGFYVVYVKLVDNNDNIIYLNTDLLLIDLTAANVMITSSFSDDVWKEFNTNLNNYYVDREISVSIQAEDLVSGVNKVYYYTSDSVLLEEDLKQIVDWKEYTNSISIIDKQTIVYVKVVDNCDYVTYVNSDLIMFNGYNLSSLSPGMKVDSSDNLYITEKSSISLNFSYQDDNKYIEGNKHQIISNVLLPEKTKITLIDKIKNKVYSYITTDSDYGYNDCVDEICEAKYDFELFTEIGSKNKFQESNYHGIINEDFVVAIDFANTDIKENIDNISITLRLNNENVNEIRNTLFDSIKKFNVIYEDSHAYFTLDTDFKDTINYNVNKEYIVDFETKLNYKNLNGNKIFDTTFEDKNVGLSIKFVDSNGNSVDKKYLKNISFMIGDKKYSPFSDGIVRINLENGISDVTDKLIIRTYADNSKIESGNYKFIINLYTSYDGIYSNENLASVEIPVYVGENIYNYNNNFNVIMNDDDKIITTTENEFDFEILLGEVSANTNVRMSLYKKNMFSAYDQNYTLIDLGKYLTNNSYEKYDNYTYYVSNKLNINNNIKLNLDTSLLEKNAYMFVFELYDDERLVNKISKRFIVK